jgi:hypothetical protein
MHQLHISTTQVSSVMLRPKKFEIRKKKCENWKSHRMKNKLCHEIEVNPSKNRSMPEEDYPSFWDVFYQIYFLYRHMQKNLHILWPHSTLGPLILTNFLLYYVRELSCRFQIFWSRGSWKAFKDIFLCKHIHIVAQPTHGVMILSNLCLYYFRMLSCKFKIFWPSGYWEDEL